jgi:glycosyltransferase involved in cell wall biosynthesis
LDISVVIPLYNKCNSIASAIESITKQKYPAKEIIVVNDGSTDGSEKIVESLENPIIRLITQLNTGVSSARNKGIELAKCEWIAFLDADDYWCKGYLETISELHIKFPKAQILGSNYRYQDHSGAFSNTRFNKLRFTHQQEGLLFNYFEVAAHSSPPLWSSAVVVSKLALLEIGGFPLGVKSGEDLITWAKLAVQNNIAYTTKALATFVLDPAHSYDEKPNRSPQIPDIVGLELKKIYNKHSYIKGLKQYVAHWHKMRASIYLRFGDRSKALNEILKTLRYQPFQIKVFIYLLLLFLPNKWTLSIFKRLT